MFIPVGAKIKFTIIPWATLLIAALCIITTWQQERNKQAIEAYTKSYCVGEVAREVEQLQGLIFRSGSSCNWILGHILMGSYFDGKDHLRGHIQRLMNEAGLKEADRFETLFNDYAKGAPSYLTANLWEDVSRWNPLRSLTGSVAHGSWDHLVGNLFFFFAFALVVETAVGSRRFIALCVAMALGIGMLQNLLAYGENKVTVGLSGVVMAVMTLAAWMAPRIRIRFFYWFFVYVGVIAVPLWAVAIWYVGWDLYDHLFSMGYFNTNYIAHLAGALMGLIIGLTMYRNNRNALAENILLDERELTEDETWLEKMNAIATAPVILGIGFVVAFILFVLVFKFIYDFAIQLLIISPVLIAIYGIKRMEKEARPDWTRYQQAMEYLKSHNYEGAGQRFAELADTGYPKAMYQLARLYQGGKGVARDLEEAVDWLKHASNRGYAPAQYRLAACYADGAGVERNVDVAIALYEKAMNSGMAEAAMSLAHYVESHPDKSVRDMDRVTTAYATAMKLFKRSNDEQGAEAARKCLHNVCPHHPDINPDQ